MPSSDEIDSMTSQLSSNELGRLRTIMRAKMADMDAQ
jgi:hypothetical protein